MFTKFLTGMFFCASVQHAVLAQPCDIDYDLRVQHPPYTSSDCPAGTYDRTGDHLVYWGCGRYCPGFCGDEPGGGGGGLVSPIDCTCACVDSNYIANPNGEWHVLGTTNGEFEITFEEGNKHTWTDSTSQSWSLSASETFTQGYQLRIRSASQSVTGQTAYTTAGAASQAFEKTTRTTATYRFAKPGVVWQWHFNSESGHLGNTTTLTPALMLTPSAVESPCCLPGFFADFENPANGHCLSIEGEPVYSTCPPPAPTLPPTTPPPTTTDPNDCLFPCYASLCPGLPGTCLELCEDICSAKLSYDDQAKAEVAAALEQLAVVF